MECKRLLTKRMLLLIVMVIVLNVALFAQAPVIRVAPANIDFEEVEVGQFGTESYRIFASNIEDRLIIGSTNPFFAMSVRGGDGFTRRLILEAVDGVVEQTVFVRFMPRHPGVVRGEIIHRTRNLQDRVVVEVSGVGTGNRPNIVINPERIDFGRVAVGEHSIDFYRIGAANITAPVHILATNPQVTISLTEDGEYGNRLLVEPIDGNIRQDVFVRYQPRTPGELRAQIVHRIGLVNVPVNLPVTGTAYNPENQQRIIFNPEQIDFERVVVGTEAYRVYGLLATEVPSPMIIVSSNPQVHISLQRGEGYAQRIEVEPVDGNIRRNIYVRFSPRVPGELRAQILHRFINVNVPSALPVTGFAVPDNNQQPLTFDPDRILFGRVPIGETAIESYAVMGTEIRGNIAVYSNNPQVKISFEEEGEFVHRLEIIPNEGNVRRMVYVSYAPRAQGELRAAILHNLAMANVEIPLPVSGFGVGNNNQQRLVFNPEQIAFGRVPLGESVTRNYTIQGVDIPDRLTVFCENPQITMSLDEEGEFAHRLEINPTEGIINTSVYVKYAPRVAGELRAAIHHRIPDHNAPISLPLSGFGVEGNNEQRLAADTELIDFGRVAIGQAANISYGLSGQNLPGDVVIAAGIPNVTISLDANEGFRQRLVIIPTDGAIDQNIYVRYAPRTPGELRGLLIHHLVNANGGLMLPVVGFAYMGDREETLDNETDKQPIVRTELLGNYPNPFNPETTIKFSLQNSSFVDLSVYNLQGQKISTLISNNLPAGEHNALWNGKDSDHNSLPSGIYLYSLDVEGSRYTGRMILLK